MLWGVWGGFPPIIGRTWPPCVERGGLGGILPPILGRKDFGGPGEAGEKGGSGRGSAAPSVVVCLSVTMRTSPSCLGRSRRNFRWGSGSWSGTFIFGTGPIGQGLGKKRAGNSNFGCFTLKKWLVFWLCMVARWCLMLFSDARWSLGGPRWSPGTARGLA